MMNANVQCGYGRKIQRRIVFLWCDVVGIVGVVAVNAECIDDNIGCFFCIIKQNFALGFLCVERKVPCVIGVVGIEG